MYSIPWFITYFAARVTEPCIALHLWDRISQSNGDPMFIFFFAVALIVSNRTKIMSCDQADLPQCMTQLNITSIGELDVIIRQAEHIEENTPYSFR